MARRFTFLILLVSMLFVGQAKADQISEFVGNPDGADPDVQEVELLGTPNAVFDLWILSIESDPGPSQGTVDRGENVTGTYDANGLAVVSIDDLENPSFTLILAEDFTGTVGTTDIDTNNDGVVDDTSSIVGIMDVIGALDSLDDFAYGSQLGGVVVIGDGTDPLLVFRDGTTGAVYANVAGPTVLDSSGEVVTGDFSADPAVPTFGSMNPSLGGVSTVVLGDANCDGVVNFLDITPFIALVTTGDIKAQGDIDGSGVVDFLDITPFIFILSAQ